LAELGAEEVVAMDRSPEILEEARRVIAASPPEIRGRIEVVRGDEQTLRQRRQWARKQRRDERFDIVLSSLTLMMCSSRQCLSTVLGALLEVLRPGGVALLVITHPCFRHDGFGSFHYDFPLDWSYWASGTRYGVVLHPEDGDLEARLSDHHWTLTDYARAIAETGGSILDLRELPSRRSDTGEPLGSPAYLALLVAARPSTGSRVGPVSEALGACRGNGNGRDGRFESRVRS
jgi:SAM-dependent methyltransferase